MNMYRIDVHSWNNGAPITHHSYDFVALDLDAALSVLVPLADNYDVDCCLWLHHYDSAHEHLATCDIFHDGTTDVHQFAWECGRCFGRGIACTVNEPDGYDTFDDCPRCDATGFVDNEEDAEW